MTERHLPETSYAVLGLIDKRPASSGYELAQIAEQSFAYFWPVSRTLLYRELRRLEALGWVTGTPVPQEKAPEKRTYSITEAGRDQLAAWLASPGHPKTAMRSGFLLKFFFANRMTPQAVTALLHEYRAELGKQRDELAATAERLAGVPRARFGRLAAVHGLRTAEARLAWADEALQDLSHEHPGLASAPAGELPGRAPG